MSPIGTVISIPIDRPLLRRWQIGHACLIRQLADASALTWAGLILSGTTMVSCRTFEASAMAPGCGK